MDTLSIATEEGIYIFTKATPLSEAVAVLGLPAAISAFRILANAY